MPRPRCSAFGSLMAIGLVALTGCGPFGYIGKVSRSANRAVAMAEAAEAEQYAAYEYWGAVTYLEQAREMMGYSEYERAFDYGTRARQLAEEAKVKADRVRAGRSIERATTDDSPASAPPRPRPNARPNSKPNGKIERRSHTTSPRPQTAVGEVRSHAHDLPRDLQARSAEARSREASSHRFSAEAEIEPGSEVGHAAAGGQQ